jgi:hypothetical protein
VENLVALPTVDVLVLLVAGAACANSDGGDPYAGPWWFVITGLAGLAYYTLDFPDGPGWLSLFVALYTLTALGDGRRSLLTAGVGMAILTVGWLIAVTDLEPRAARGWVFFRIGASVMSTVAHAPSPSSTSKPAPPHTSSTGDRNGLARHSRPFNRPAPTPAPPRVRSEALCTGSCRSRSPTSFAM